MADIERILKELEARNEKGHYFNIQKDAGRLLQMIVKIKQPKSVIEVGSSNGYSSILMASAWKAKVFTFELDKNKAEEARDNFKKSGLKNIKLIEGDALELLKNFKTKADMIFLDARKRDYLKYFKLLEKNMNNNCLVIADNVISHSEKVKDYLGYVKTNYDSVTLNIGSGLELTVKCM